MSRRGRPGLRWQRPAARLLVAGTVTRDLPALPEGVSGLGVVGDLGPLYARAGVVISPLRLGSGLKLVEAAGHGNAVVVTAATLQGVEAEMDGAVRAADEPAVFAAEMASLLDDPEARRALGSGRSRRRGPTSSHRRRTASSSGASASAAVPGRGP